MVGLLLTPGSVPAGSTLSVLYPWASALSDSSLPSFCSACFSSCSSPSASFCPGLCHGAVAYCSAECKDLDLPLHLRSAECCLLSLTSDGSYDFASLGGTCDLRVALRLLACHESMESVQRFLASPGSADRRLGGLLSNRASLLLLTDSLGRSVQEQEEAHTLATELKAAVILMHRARNDALVAFCGTSRYGTLDNEILLLEEVMCQVVTNGVSIQSNPFTMTSENSQSYRCDEIGTAVYNPFFSWINHSCRPNACYSFVFGDSKHPGEACKSRFAPDVDIECVDKAWGLDLRKFQSIAVSNKYGPRVHLRSICDIDEREAVFISYTSLLQPKSMRNMELWIKYRFDCDCKRCNAIPVAYADDILEKFGFPGSHTLNSKLQTTLKDDLERGLTELLDNDDPLSCCEVLEHGLLGILEESSLQKIQHSMQSEKQHATTVFCSSLCDEMHVMHHLCLEIYMVLSSSYKILSSGCSYMHEGMRPVNACIWENDSVRFALASAAYKLLLAGCVQKLYDSGESGLISTSAHVWLECGESLIRALIEIDAHFHIDGTKEYEKLCIWFLEPNSLRKELLEDVKDCFNTETGIEDVVEHAKSCPINILRNLAHLIWPLLQGSSLFLSSIRTPFSVEVNASIEISKSRNNILRESWIKQRTAVLLSAIFALQQSFDILTICYGCTGRIMEVLQNVMRQIHCMQS